jgi:hypothetical protein
MLGSMLSGFKKKPKIQEEKEELIEETQALTDE